MFISLPFCAKSAARKLERCLRVVDDEERELGGNLVCSIGDETRPPKTSTT